MQDTTNFKKWQTILPWELILIIFTNFDSQKGSWTLLDTEWLTSSNMLYKKLTNISTKNFCDRQTLLTLDIDICRFHTDVKTESRKKNLVQKMIYNTLDNTIFVYFSYLTLKHTNEQSTIFMVFSRIPHLLHVFHITATVYFVNCSTISFCSLSHHRIIDISFSAWVEMVQIIIVPLADAQFMHNQFSLRCFQLSEDCS